MSNLWGNVKYIMKKVILLLLAILALLFLILCLYLIRWLTPVTPKKVVSGRAVRGELRRIKGRDFWLDWAWYELDYAQQGLIVVHNTQYTFVLKETEDNWNVSNLLNPLPSWHYRQQGSTISNVAVDAGQKYIAIYSIGVDGLNDPLYIFDLEKDVFTEYAHDDFPPDFVTPPPEIEQYAFDPYTDTVTFYNDNDEAVKAVQLAYPSETSVFLYDENRLVYMAAEGGYLDNYWLCFQNIDSGEIEKIRIWL